MLHPELPFVSFLCAVLVLIPLPFHWQAGTVSTLCIVAWLFVCNVINGVNTVLWRNDVIIRATTWCDVGEWL